MGSPGDWLKPSVFILVPGQEEANGHIAQAQPFFEEGVTMSLALPTHMWLAHATSGESRGQKTCADLNPETQPLRRSHSRAAFEGVPHPALRSAPLPLVCHMLAGPSTILEPKLLPGPEWGSSSASCPHASECQVPLNTCLGLPQSEWPSMARGKRGKARAPTSSDTSMGHLVSAEILVSLGPRISHTLRAHLFRLASTN